ncbi:MAG: NADH-quinone oxidoreductase subunit N [Chlorobi bacterium]|nr:NADH-quinone oxidoreductase subunit N [Chlorobiota bacterium]
MNWQQLSLMQTEIFLVLAVLLVLLADIFTGKDKKSRIIHLAHLLFAAVFVSSFFMLDKEGRLFGGSFNTYPLVAFFKSILMLGVGLIMLQSVEWVKKELIPKGFVSEFYALMWSSLLGLFFMISAGDFLMFYLGLELSTMPVAGLVAFEFYRKRSAEAALKMVLLAAMASAIMLFGISLIYATSGSIYFEQVRASAEMPFLELVGFAMLLAGIAFKISLVPFHFWTADVYEGAPTVVSNYLSVISKGAAVYILMILLFITLRRYEQTWTIALYILAVLTMFVGNLFALRQQNMKRFLAFSSIAQAGFILLGVIGGNVLGIKTVIYFLLIYIFSNVAAFGVVHVIAMHSGKENIDDYEGLYRTNPRLSLLLMLALFSLAGIPPVAGFFGKFFLYSTAASKGFYWLVFIAVVNVTISLYYYLLPVRAAFLRRSENPIPYFKTDLYSKIGFVILALGLILIGLYSPLYEYIAKLSEIL